jgi:ATP-dependent protease Clp ATPase subunit
VRPAALQAIAKQALARKTGARGLRSISNMRCSTPCMNCRMKAM